ncbi:MAG: helix-turn-helix domain-containing protein [Patescibacteria group bacterium]|nr:helix-turn-helix domain-containing protein [Patescibacteria group bacterium]
MADHLPPQPFTPESLAERWACSPDHIRSLCRRGRIDCFVVGRGLYRIPLDAVSDYEARRCGSSSTAGGGMPSGERAARPGAVPSVPKIVMPLPRR